MVREHATADRYGDLVRSEEYRNSRRAKAEVIWHLCGADLRAARVALDLGAGTGIIRETLDDRMSGALFGIEIDASFVDRRARMVAADVEKLPIASDAVDFLIVNHLYEHVMRPTVLFQEAHRVLRPAGRAYVSAGNRLALIEPHYRLPFLSWLPGPAATAYLRLSGRGERYEGIRFLTYRPLVRTMREAGFTVHDVTAQTIDELLERTWGEPWSTLWRGGRRVPGGARERLLHLASPQWFFMLEKPARDGTQ